MLCNAIRCACHSGVIVNQPTTGNQALAMHLLLNTREQFLTAQSLIASSHTATPTLALSLPAAIERLIGNIGVSQVHTLLGEQLTQAMHLTFQRITHPGIGAGKRHLGLILRQIHPHFETPKIGRPS